MVYLLIGLFAFLGLHSIRVVAPDWRRQRIQDWGETRWKLLYSLAAIVSFVMLLWAYSQARATPVLIWVPPAGLRHVASLLVLAAFVLLVAAYLPRNHLQARLGHPMTLAIKLWATAHLLMSGWLHAMLLFACMLAWAVLVFRSARRRPSPPSPAPSALATVMTLLLGAALWAGFAFYLHLRWIGIAPFG